MTHYIDGRQEYVILLNIPINLLTFCKQKTGKCVWLPLKGVNRLYCCTMRES